ncbi:MAG: glycoside-pentoside-hexuronide (GPH):cation symporter [Clostridia bacterium]|nr:glycoside-pentoside-hexuronide (GPH):cation symporter [Clostridia bacterium]
MKSVSNRNHYTFGLGTIGRDMLYTLVSMNIMFYLTDILQLSNSMLWWLTSILLAARIFDAINDPFMGVIVDNTRSRFGKFKPWIAIGAVLSGIFTTLMFTDFGLRGAPFLILFALTYLMWDLSFTANDISYWSMLPSLSMDQKEREKIGAFARICANIGLFAVVAGIVPATKFLGNLFGSMQMGYFSLAIMITIVMWGGQCITLFGVKELKGVFRKEEQTSLKDMFSVIFKNDQLLFTAIAMALFMIGYSTTTSFGLYFFKYAYGDVNMYSLFALVLGVSQIVALIVFPIFSKRFNRKTLYTAATVLVVLGYVIFFISPMNMLFIGTSGVLLFIGQAFIQLLMLMFLADTIEYGQWKLGKRNDSITLSLQPFINKMGAAIASGIVGATVIISGMSDANSAADMTPQGLLIMKTAMLILPLLFIVAGYLVYRWKYKIDSKMYQQMLQQLEARGDIKLDEGA